MVDFMLTLFYLERQFSTKYFEYLNFVEFFISHSSLKLKYSNILIF